MGGFSGRITWALGTTEVMGEDFLRLETENLGDGAESFAAL